MRYSICFLVRGKFSKFHSSLVEKLGNKFDEKYLIENPRPTHVTLKYPFEDIGEILEVELLIKKYILNLKKTKISINKIKQFENKVVVFDFDFSKDAKKIILDFQNKLKKINWINFRDFDNNVKDNSHLTIIYGNTKEKFETIWDFVNKNINVDFELEFDNISILKEVKPKIWKVHKIFEIEND